MEDKYVSETGVKQSFIPSRLDLVPPESLLLLGECLGYGAENYGEDNWKSAETEEDHHINIRDNLNHAINHIYKHLEGDQTEMHLVNATARLNFAIWHAVKVGVYPRHYIHD